MSNLRVLAYHAISDLPRADPAWRYGVPLPDFRNQVEQLSRSGYTFVGASQLLASMAGRLRLPNRSVLITFDDCYVSLDAAARWLAGRGIPGVAFAISAALAPGTRVAGTIEPLLDGDGLRSLVAAGFEIGAHSHSHRPLTAVPPEEQEAEISGAFARLKAAGVGPVRLFAYPYGVYDHNVCDQVRRAGAEGAMTVDPGFIRAGDDPFHLHRIEIFRGETGLAFRAKVATAGGVGRLQAYLRLRTRLRRLQSRTH